MPFLRIDACAGRNEQQVKDLLDAVHRAIVSAFQVPLRDRYQVYEEHSESNFIVEDTGLRIPRTRNVIVISITSRPRTEEQKKALYTKLCEGIEAELPYRTERCCRLHRYKHRY
jgi:phenylpyruvate tautomerase PptA (4-oxalocrotonate tautomerase family)